MANAYSYLNNFDEKLFSPDINLINTVLQTKQSKLDNNRMKIEKALSDVGNLDLIRDIDKEYAANRLNEVTDIVNRYANEDLSSNVLTQSLIRDTGQVLDTNVKNALVSTKLYRNDLQRWNDFQAKNPDKYLERNQAFSMNKAGVNSWLSSEDISSSYSGGAKVIENFDYVGALNKEMPEILENMGISQTIDTNGFQKYVMADGQEVSAYTVLNKVKSLPKDLIRKVTQSRLTNQAYQQMQIDSWDRYGRGQALDQTREAYSNYISNNKKTVSSKISDIETFLKREDLNSETKEAYKNVLSNYKNSLNSLESTQANIADISYDKMSFEMYQEDFFKGMEDAYYMEPTVIDTEVKENKLQIKMFDHALRMEEAKQKTLLKTQTTTSTTSPKTSDSNVQGVGDVNLERIPGEGFHEVSEQDSFSVVGKFDSRFKEQHDKATSLGIDLGEINAENISKINSYNGGSTFNGKPIGNEQRLALQQLKDLSEEKLFEIESLTTDFGEGSEKVLSSLLNSQDYDSGGAADYDFHIEVDKNGNENMVIGNGSKGNFSWATLYNKAKEGALNPSEQKTLELKNKLSYINGAYRGGEYTENQANILLTELSKEDDLDLFIPKTVEDFKEPGAMITNPAAPMSNMTVAESQIYTEKVLPYLTAIGVKDYGDTSTYLKLVSKMSTEGLNVIPDNFKDIFTDKARKDRLVLPRRRLSYDTYYDQLGRGDLERTQEGEFADRGTLIVDGQEYGFTGYVNQRTTVLNQNLKKGLKEATLDSFKDRFVINNPEDLPNLNLVFEKAGVFEEFDRNIKPTKNTTMQFVPQADGRVAIVGSFEYKSQGILDKNAPTVQVGFGLSEEEGDNKFFTISKNEFEQYVVGQRVQNKTYNPYSINQRGEHAKTYTQALDVVSRNNGKVQIDGTLEDVIQQNYIDLVNSSDKLKALNLPILNHNQLIEQLSNINLNVHYVPENGQYYRKITNNNSDFEFLYEGDIRPPKMQPFDIPVTELSPERRVQFSNETRLLASEIIPHILIQNLINSRQESSNTNL